MKKLTTWKYNQRKFEEKIDVLTDNQKVMENKIDILTELIKAHFNDSRP